MLRLGVERACIQVMQDSFASARLPLATPAGFTLRDPALGLFAIQATNFAMAALARITSASAPMRASSLLVKLAWIVLWQIGWTGTFTLPFFDLGTG